MALLGVLCSIFTGIRGRPKIIFFRSVSVSDFKGLSKATREAVILERQCQVEKQALLQKERSAEEAAFSQSQAGATAQLHKDLLKVCF